MAISIIVEAYPDDDAARLHVEELTSFGWIEIEDTATIGTHPNYTTQYSVTTTTTDYNLRVRWELTSGSLSVWTAPLSITVTPTAPQIERIEEAIISKAIRLLVLPEAPYGAFGETGEFGGLTVTVKPDHAIREMLYGLSYKHLDISAVTVTTSEVIRAGFSMLEADFQADKVTDVTRAIAAAKDWVTEYLKGFGVA